jgi:hypothetical protein
MAPNLRQIAYSNDRIGNSSLSSQPLGFLRVNAGQTEIQARVRRSIPDIPNITQTDGDIEADDFTQRLDGWDGDEDETEADEM